MDNLRGRYSFPYRGLELQVGTNSAVLTQTFKVQSLPRERRRDDGLNGFRGAVNAALISLAFWVAIRVALFAFS